MFSLSMDSRTKQTSNSRKSFLDHPDNHICRERERQKEMDLLHISGFLNSGCHHSWVNLKSQWMGEYNASYWSIVFHANALVEVNCFSYHNICSSIFQIFQHCALIVYIYIKENLIKTCHVLLFWLLGILTHHQWSRRWNTWKNKYFKKGKIFINKIQHKLTLGSLANTILTIQQECLLKTNMFTHLHKSIL